MGVFRMVDAPRDLLEPPKFMHKKVWMLLHPATLPKTKKKTSFITMNPD